MINPNKILQIAGKAKSMLFDNLTRALVKATYLFGFTYKQFVENYEKGLVAEGKQRGMSIVEISSSTGLDRRRVSSMMKIETSPKQHQSVRFTILLKLYEYQQNTNNGKPIYIEHFNRIVKQHRDGNIVTSPELFLKLICSENIGCAVNLGKHIDIISPCLNEITNLDTLMEIFSDNTSRYIDTIEYNVVCTKGNKLFERLMRSTQIPTEKHTRVNDEINEILLRSFMQIKTTFVKHETNVERDTYPEIGVHFYQFFQQQKVNHEENSSTNTIVSFNNTK
ncbi:MAG: hypothetical protein JKX98_00705 [Alcanivoracaceae bacterium]|nr:hypothetical protein [Alcanivoracaceae bacterium]